MSDERKKAIELTLVAGVEDKTKRRSGRERFLNGVTTAAFAVIGVLTTAWIALLAYEFVQLVRWLSL